MEDKKKDDLNETVIKPAGKWITINFEEIWSIFASNALCGAGLFDFE